AGGRGQACALRAADRAGDCRAAARRLASAAPRERRAARPARFPLWRGPPGGGIFPPARKRSLGSRGGRAPPPARRPRCPAVGACGAALWTTQARRAMENHGLSPADTAVAVLVQPLIDARASGGGLSETAEGRMLISATWGLGSAIAQGEVVPDRIVLSRQGFVRAIEAGRKHHREPWGHGAGALPQLVPGELATTPCLDAAQAVTLGRLLRKAEAVIGGPVEIEWALDRAGFKLLQARPLTVEPV